MGIKTQSMQKTTVAALKIASQFRTAKSLDYNVKTIMAVIDKAADQNAKIVVMPETAITGYARQDLSTTRWITDRKYLEGITGYG